MIALITKYRKNDNTHALLSLARYFDKTGRKYFIARYGWRSKSVDPLFDGRVEYKSFKQIITKADYFVITSPIDDYFINTAREEGIKCYLYTGLDSFQPFDNGPLKAFHNIFLPSNKQAECVKEGYKIKNTRFLPFPCHMPITKKDGKRDSINLFLSLYGQQLKRIDVSSLLIIFDIMRNYSYVNLAIGSDKGLSNITKTEIKKAKKEFDNRLVHLEKCGWQHQLLYIGYSDLLIYPSLLDSHCMMPISSLYMGTPIICWNLSVLNEYIRHNNNGIIIDCDIEENWIKMQKCKPDYNKFYIELKQLLSSQDNIIDLQKNTDKDIRSWQEIFKRAADHYFPL